MIILSRKKNKSTIERHIERRLAPAKSIPLPTACIIDGMRLVNKIHGDKRTIGDIAKSIFQIAIQSGNVSSLKDIGFDVYKYNSIKTTECEDREVASGLAHGSVVVSHKIQWWRRLLRSSASKNALIKFLCQAWRNDTYPEKLGSELLFITCGKQCFKVTKDGSEVVDELAAFQEKAYTRTLLHNKHVSSNYIYMVIVTKDKDVFIICLSVFHQISDICISDVEQKQTTTH